jgi:hypothetical protein
MVSGSRSDRAEEGWGYYAVGGGEGCWRLQNSFQVASGVARGPRPQKLIRSQVGRLPRRSRACEGLGA